MCCKCYSPILTLKGNICLLGMVRNGAAGHGESVHKAQTSDHFGPFPNRDGGGRGGLSVHRRGSALLMIAPDCTFLSDHVRSKGHRQTVQVQSVWVGLCAVPFNKRYHTLKNYKRSPRYLIGQIAGQIIKKICTCILLWHSIIVIIYLLSPVLLLFPLFLIS